MRFNYVPTLRALLALNRGDPSKAIELLEVARSYELGFLGFDSVVVIGSLYPVYVRGLAYLAEHQSAKAAGEFRKVLDHGGIIFADPVGALAHLQLGRAFAQPGDISQAKAACQDFLTLWKDADPGIPILKQAKAECAALR